MAWTAPRTWVDGETVTSAILDAHIRDNLTVLKTNISDEGLIALILPLSTQVSNVTTSGTGETDFHTYTLPGGTLTQDGQRIEVWTYGTATSSANTKTWKAYFGASSITLHAGTATITLWEIRFVIIRRDATHQDMYGYVTTNNNTSRVAPSDFVQISPTETLSGDVVIKTTGRNQTAGSITEKWFDARGVF
jgi:hypothetical protein